ncbi:nucleotidyltransferase domain-containing protein [Gemmatimonadota bacterium]
MRQPSTPSSAFYHPFDAILGTIARIRILRELCVHGGELSTSILAERAGLSRFGASNAISDLVAHGVVRPVGLGRSVPYALNLEHTLAIPLMVLFQAEAQRVDTILQIVRDAAERMDLKPSAIWLYGSVARGEDTAGSDIDLAVINYHGDADSMAALLREALDEVADPSITISVISLSGSGIDELEDQKSDIWEQIQTDAITVFGSPPEVVAHG